MEKEEEDEEKLAAKKHYKITIYHIACADVRKLCQLAFALAIILQGLLSEAIIYMCVCVLLCKIYGLYVHIVQEKNVMLVIENRK